MTVATTLNKITYAGTGGTTSFPFSFSMPGGLTTSQVAQQLVVTFVSSGGVATVVAFGPNTNQYQLTLTPPVSPNPTGLGGIVTYNPGGTPIAIGTTLTIQRILPEIQGTSYQNQGTLWQTVVEQSLDYLTMCVQQIQATFGNFIQAPQTDPVGLNYTTPPAAQRANLALIFDGMGNVSVGAVSSATVSAAMIPVVGASTLAIARTALGLGTMATEGIGGGLQDDGANNARVFFPNTALAVTTTITSAHFLNKIKTTGPITLNLPRANTLWSGFGFWVENLNPGGGVTITVNAADQIENFGSGVSYILQVGDCLYLSTNAASSGTWFLELTQGTTTNPTPPAVASKFTSIVATGSVGNNTVNVSAAFVSVTDGINFYTVTPTGSINFATAGAGGLDTGSIAAASWYYIWAIYNPTTLVSNWIVSLQSTANGTFLAALPSGFKAYGLYGVLRTAPATAALMGTVQYGTKVEYIVGIGQTAALPAAATGAAGSTSVPTWVSESLTAIVPPNAKSYNVVLRYATTSGAADCMAAPSSSYGAINSTTNPPPLSLAGFQTAGAGLNSNSMLAATATFLGPGPVFYASSGSQAGQGLFIDGFDLNL